jgi:hypothetical protein
MSVKLNRPPKPEESQKNANVNGKTIPYPGFAPGTSGSVVITTAPFGSVHCAFNYSVYSEINIKSVLLKTKNLTTILVFNRAQPNL